MIHTVIFANSGMLQDIEYNSETMLLTVNFKSGRTYQYTDIPYSIYMEFKSAGSAGTYYNQHIKGIYPHPQIEQQ